jgi:N4-gp56 family major capsid protein
MVALNLSKELRMVVQPLCKFRQFCDVKDASQQGTRKGATFHWDIFSDVATQGTTLVETTTMPETQFTITQGTLTITEYGNSVPYSGKLDNLSSIPVREIINKVLKNDAKKAFDIAAEAEFTKCALRVVSSSSDTTTFTTATTGGIATNTYALTRVCHTSIVDWMKERNIPPYEADDYMLIAHPTTLRGLKTDLEGVYQYTETGFARIVNGEVGRYESCRFVEQTNIAKMAFAQNKSNWAYYMGSDTVAEAIAVPEEMRGRIPGDFGRSMGVAWFYLGGFGIVHTTPAQARIVKWDSAA